MNQTSEEKLRNAIDNLLRCMVSHCYTHHEITYKQHDKAKKQIKKLERILFK